MPLDAHAGDGLVGKSPLAMCSASRFGTHRARRYRIARKPRQAYMNTWVGPWETDGSDTISANSAATVLPDLTGDNLARRRSRHRPLPLAGPVAALSDFRRMHSPLGSKPLWAAWILTL